jgi:MFS transporter, PAT family, beta-lactamase induction signal transducer AmpG
MTQQKFYIHLTLYALIYFVQGAMLTFFMSYNVLYLRSFQVDFSVIGFVNGIMLIPFILKIFIGLLSDRVNFFGLGHRKPYIILGLSLQSMGFLFLTGINPIEQTFFYIVILLLTALGMSTYDTCTDGFSIDTTPKDQRGKVQGMMVGGRALSSIISAFAFGLLAKRQAWTALFLIIAGLSLSALIFVLSIKEPVREANETEEKPTSPMKALGQSSYLTFLLIGLIYPLALYSTNSMISPFLHEALGVGMNTVGAMLASFGIGSVIGALTAGPQMKKLGRAKSLFTALAITVFATICLVLIQNVMLIWGVIILFGIAFGYYETIFFALAMDFAQAGIAAFMFSISMAVGNLGIGAGQPLAGVLVDRLGFRWLFLVSAGIHLLVIPFALRLFKNQPERDFAD